ncbi:hypothetical protein E4634_06535 [Mangrovimicrobium sediminis]|uniref:C-type lysozyme inhibitor domain-containing protein n=1 Tax=Mangrovimicrobium sediminis TaxID=2562682 RepID=A0A4Z0M694_9GAMM|nr:hypothetical protein E4634_06535 [Haliea sp. SAOS-164]
MLPVAACLFALACTQSHADSVEARCDIYPAGDDHASRMLACRFSQRQGYVTITREDGVVYDLVPDPQRAGRYTDQDGQPVVRDDDLGDQGLIFRLAGESVYVYWSTAALQPTTDNPTAPFSTDDYDATTLLRCRGAQAADFGQCPAGILRMDGGEGSVVVLSPAGEQFTINFMRDYVNATNREVEATLQGDTWTITTGSGEVYEVPVAAIEGG